MSEKQISNHTTETETLREFYAAINRNDITAASEFCDVHVERIEFEGLPSAGTYRGHAEVKAHLSQGRETWAEGGCEPEQFIVAGDKVVAFLHVRVRWKKDLEWIEGRIADVFTFRNDKIIQMRTFAERQQALAWAGVKASSTD